MSHVITGCSGIYSLVSLPRMIYWTALRYSSCSASAEQRQLQASHSSTFPRAFTKHQLLLGVPLWRRWHQAQLQPCRQTSHTAPAPRMLFLPSHPVCCRIKGMGRGKLSQSIAASASLPFPPHHYITFRPQAWNCCSCTLLAQDKIFFAFLKIEPAHKRACRGLWLLCFAFFL